MFGTEIHLVTFLYIVFQASLIIPSILSILIQPNEKFRIRFFILNLLFLSYNITNGLFPDNRLNLNLQSQNIIGWSVGFITVVFLLFYIYQEYNIKPLKLGKMQNLIVILSISFLFLFIIPYVMTNDLGLSRILFLISTLVFVVITVYSSFMKFIKDYKKTSDSYYLFRFITGYLSVFSVICLPIIILSLGDNQPIEHGFFNFGFIFIAITYAFKMIRNNKINIKMESKNSIDKEKYNGLTDRQKEICFLIYNNPKLNNKDLSSMIFIEAKTFSSHTTKIYDKLNLQNRSKDGLYNFLLKLYN